MVTMFKSKKREPWEIEEIEQLLSTMGYVTMFRIGVLSRNDIIGLQGYVGGVYVGPTVLLTPISVHYDKLGIPFYRLKRYTPPSKKTAYERFKHPGISWDGT